MITLANPWILLILPLPWLIRRVLPQAPQPSHAILRVPFYSRLASLLEHTQPVTHLSSHFSRYLVTLTWILLVISATGPQWLGKPVQIQRQGHNLIFALDISGSMQIPDMELNQHPVDRLTLVKDIASHFIADRESDRIGLILFGSRAYLQTPLTYDQKTIQYMLEDATIGLAGPATALGDAIGLSIKRLNETPKDNRILILLTDGANNTGVLDPIQAARLAKDNNIKIYTIGIGASQMVVSGFMGNQVVNPSQDLDQDTLKEISQITGGLFFRAKDANDLRAVYNTINKLEPIKSDSGIYRPTKEFYMWPLCIALLLSWYLAMRQIPVTGRATELEDATQYG